MDNVSTLSSAILKNLSDKSYDKRKLGAKDIEISVKTLLGKEEENVKVRAIINTLHQDYCYNANANYRKGGLIGVAACSIGLMSETKNYLSELLPPVIHCLHDPESRVRYYACESLFNICKVSRTSILTFFNEIFDGVCKLFADVDMDVRSGASMLDRLIKEIVTECDAFNVEKFIPLLQKYISQNNAYVRRLLITWIHVLDGIPYISMLDWLPEFFDGLISMLSDGNREIRQEADTMLTDFVEEFSSKNVTSLQLGPLVNILVRHCSSDTNFIRLTAVIWILKFIEVGGTNLSELYASVLGAILNCINDSEVEVYECAGKANDSLLHLIRETEASSIELRPLVNTVISELGQSHVPTRTASLRWISTLFEKLPEEMTAIIDEIFPALLHTLSDDDDNVVILDLEVLIRIAMFHPDQFYKVLNDIMGLFRTDRVLLEHRGSLIIRNMCFHMNATKIYTTFAEVLLKEKEKDFSSLMVQALNLILMTATELKSLRDLLSGSFRIANNNRTSTASKTKHHQVMDVVESSTVFITLFHTWCYNPVATFSLCLLANAYELSSKLVMKFPYLDISLGFLVQLDKLVQLLESPIFVQLRMQLLNADTEDYRYLLKSLYGLLMLLPQSSAYKTLKNRLDCVSALHDGLARSSSNSSASTRKNSSSNGISSSNTSGKSLKGKMNELLQNFDKMQLNQS